MRNNLFTAEEIAAFIDRYGATCTLEQAVEITGLSERTLRRMAAKGELKRYRPKSARAYRFKTADVAAVLKAE